MDGYLKKIIRMQEGFTLVELTVTIVVLGILLGLATGIVALSAESISQTFSVTGARTELRDARRALRSDIQKMSADSLLTAQSDEITFYDQDGNYVNYHMVGSSLLRNDAVLLENVQSAPFGYRDESFNQISSPLNLIRYVELSITITYNGEVRSVSDMFYVRN